ncbi:MAG: hypothetical protein HKO64_04295, partial [Xanthomonadales bacterium]|nr:hypothetical protein [Xanthomonadales bacterium]
LFVKALAQLLTLLAAFLFLKLVKARALLIAMVIPSLVVVLQMRSMVRPELFSYAFSVLAMLLYFRARERASAASVLPMVVLMIAWTNYHASIIGYVIFAGFFVDCAVRQLNDRENAATWFRWLAWGVVLLLAGFLNHDLVHPVVEALTFPQEWKTLIFEYFAPWPYIKESPGLVILLLVTAVTPLLAIRQKKFGLLLVWAVLVYTAVSMQRMVAPAGIVIVISLAGLLAAEGYPDRLLGTGRRGLVLSGMLWFSVTGAALFANVALSLDILEENRNTYTRYPEALTRYMREEQLRGPVFNDYGIGGYLVYRLAPHNQVYIDGRTHILYPVEHLQKFETIQQSPQMLAAEGRAYGIDFVIEPFNQAKHDLVTDTGEFTLDFVDAAYSLYRRQGGRFPLHGLLLSRPACWNEHMAGELARESELIEAGLPFYSGLAEYSNFIDGYVRANDKGAYFDQSFESGEWTDFIRRFVAYRVFETGDYDLARILLANVQELRIEDYLASAMAMILSENEALALQILRSLAGDHWMSANEPQLAMFLWLWNSMSENPGLEAGDKHFIEGLEKRVEASGLESRDSSFEMHSREFCELARLQTARLGEQLGQ